MPFFDNDVKTIEREQAEQLHQALRKAGKLPPRVRIKTATYQFIQLKIKNGIPSKRIQKILDWYCRHLEDEYTPKCRTAQNFRHKFLKIEEARKRDKAQRLLEKRRPPSELAYKVADWAGQRRWPGDEKKDELQFIQVCLDTYSDYLKKLKILRDKEQSCILRMLCDIVSTPGMFVMGYLVEVNQIAWKWSKWDGNLLRWAFRYDSKIFRKQMHQWCFDWEFQSRQWDMIVSQLKGMD